MSGEFERLSDEELVRYARDGDVRAFGTLVRRYLPPALAVALEFTDRKEDAEDLVQEAFHHALRGLDKFDERLPFPSWFFTILRNLARNLAARDARWRTTPVPKTLAVDERSPFEDAHRAELQERLLAGLESLPEMQRACFRLCDVEGFSSAEVAAMLGVTAGTVRTHLHRARRALRLTLRPFMEERSSEDDD